MDKNNVKALADEENKATYPDGTVFQNVPLTAIMYDKQNTLDAVNARVAEVIDGAPSAFDTLKEIAEWIAAHPDKSVVSAVEKGSSNGKVKVTTTPTTTGSASTAEFVAYEHPTADVVAAGLYNIGSDSLGHVVIGSEINTELWDAAGLWVSAEGPDAIAVIGEVEEHSGNWNSTYATVSDKSAAWSAASSGEANLVTGATGGLTIDTQKRVTTAEGYVIPTTDVTAQWQNTTDNAPTATDSDIGLYIESNILKVSEGRFIPTTEQLGWYLDTYNVVDGASGEWNGTADTVSGKSGAWEDTASTVSGKSATWDGTTTTVSTKSANWEAGSNVTGVVEADGLTLTDKAVGVDNTHVILTKTERRKVLSAAEEVRAGSAYWYAGARVTGVTTADGLTLTDGVVGVAGTQFIPYMADGQKWEGTYGTVNEKSATWEDTAAVVALNSGDWSNVTGAINGLTVNAALQVTPDSTHVIPTTTATADWESTKETVDTNSGAWGNLSGSDVPGLEINSDHLLSLSENYVIPTIFSIASGEEAFATVATYSSDWSLAYNTLDNNSGYWDTAYLSVNANSGDWDSAYLSVEANSAAWASGEANLVTGVVTADHLTLTNKVVGIDASYSIPTTAQTANWDTAYNEVIAHEGEWGAVTGATGGLTVDTTSHEVTVADGYVIPTDNERNWWSEASDTVDKGADGWDEANEHATQDKTAAATALAAITNATDVEGIKNALIAYFSALNPTT